MTVHQCPKCELRFERVTELDHHCRQEHPSFHHDYPVHGLHHHDHPAHDARHHGSEGTPKSASRDEPAGPPPAS